MTAHAYPFGPGLVVAGDDASGDESPLLVLGDRGRAVWQTLASGGEAAAVAHAVTLGFDPAEAGQIVGAAVRATSDARLLAGRSGSPAARVAAPNALPPVARRRVYALCGQPVEVRFAARAVEALVAPRFAWSERPDTTPVATLTVARTRRGFVLREAGAPDLTAADAVAMSGLLTRRFAEISHARADWLAVLHAAAVADVRGALVLPGENGAGKSTLTAALVARGLGYLSDDCVPIDGRGLVLPVPFALCHKDRSGPRLRLTYEPPPAPQAPAAPPRLFLFPRFRTECRPEARRLTPPEALERLVAGRAWLSRRPEDMRRTLALLAATPAWELAYPSTDAALALVADCERTAAAA